MKLIPIRETGGGREGTILATYSEIKEIIGSPNVTDLDDHDKVKASWGFQDEQGRKGFVWCYKESKIKCTAWSSDGDKSLLKELFGDKYLTEREYEKYLREGWK